MENEIYQILKKHKLPLKKRGFQKMTNGNMIVLMIYGGGMVIKAEQQMSFICIPKIKPIISQI